jgi:putative tryptophan/tyrosine transport system substrate-binding protein
MRRREFIAGLGSAVAWPVMGWAQQQTKPVIGWLGYGEGPPHEAVEAFRQGLAQVGVSEGRDVTVEYHLASGRAERLPAITADLIRRGPAAIVAATDVSALAAKAATQTIPIIFMAGNDPVELGLVASFNHPGGNLTGITSLDTEVAAKRLDLLHKAVPTVEAIAMLAGLPDSPVALAEARTMQSAARTLGLRLLVIHLMSDTDIAPVFSTFAEQQIGAIVVGSGVIVQAKRNQILTLAARSALPTMFSTSLDVRAGAPLSYGPILGEMVRQAGVYTGRILKGERPADLPVVLPTKFEFVINLSIAKALGLTIPETLLATADEVIQ